MLAALLLHATQGSPAQAQGVFDRVVPLVITRDDPLLAGRGASKSIEYTSEFTGTLHAWVTAEGSLEAVLHIEDPDGKQLAEDDGAGGKRTPYARLALESASTIRIVAAASKPDVTGKLELHLVASPESAATRAAAQRAKDEIRQIQKLRGARDFVAARTRAESLLESLGGVEGGQPSEAIAAQCWALGFETKELGLVRATETAWRRALDHRLRTAPDDHVGLQAARQGYALALRALGNLEGARALEEKVLAVRGASLPDDDPELQKARGNLAITLKALGDFARARALEERVLEIDSRTLRDYNPDLQAARQNLGITLAALGDYSAARVLFERVLEADSAALPDDDRALQGARGNLALALQGLGDLSGARALEEKTLEVLSRALPDDHPEIQSARLNLGTTLSALDDLPGALALWQKVLETRVATLPEDHRDLQLARMNVGNVRRALGQLPEARVLLEQVLAAGLRVLPADDPDLQLERQNLARTLLALHDFQAALQLYEQVLAVRSRSMPDDHGLLQSTRSGMALTLAAECSADQAQSMSGKQASEFAALARPFAQSVRRAAELAILTGSSREAEERCAGLSGDVGYAISFADGLGIFPADPDLGRDAFLASEATRDAAQASAALARLARDDPRYAELRGRLRAASEDVTRLAQSGAKPDEFRGAVSRRDGLERELIGLAHGSGGELDFDSLAKRVRPREAFVAYRRYGRWGLKGAAGPERTECLCVFVLRAGSQFERVELGPIAPIERAVEDWRDALGTPLERGSAVPTAEDRESKVRASGEALRKLVVDPLLPLLGKLERVVFVLDDVLHAVPLDALPLETLQRTPGLLGERFALEMRLSLRELLARPRPIQGVESLVALGGASFNSEPLGASAEDAERVEGARESAPVMAALLRGGRWEQGFEPLTYTGLEARGVAALFEEVFGDKAPVLVLEKRRASRAAAAELAPKARWLHLATHGWFAPESVRSSEDPEPIDALSGLGQRLGAGERVKGASPLVLCGLALAGANLPPDAVGRYPGLVTAEEIASWDLANCELATLSACDTNVGERRAGQGVASLQKALHMAGARSVITSLWKVPDEATKELMLDFYRRIWVGKTPKARALWEAKLKLRAAKDASGKPKYRPCDWAAWVLTGDPD